MFNSELHDQYLQVKEYFPKILEKESNKDYYEDLNRLLRSVPNYYDSMISAVSIINVGIEYLNNDELDKAYEYFEESKRVMATSDGWFYCGVVNYQRGNLARAIAELSASVLMYFPSEKARLFRAKSLFTLLDETGNLNKSANNIDMVTLLTCDLVFVIEDELGEIDEHGMKEAKGMLEDVHYVLGTLDG